MDMVGMVRRLVGVDERVKAGYAEAATAFHAPESGRTAHGGENRQRSVDSHGFESKRATLRSKPKWAQYCEGVSELLKGMPFGGLVDGSRLAGRNRRMCDCAQKLPCRATRLVFALMFRETADAREEQWIRAHLAAQPHRNEIRQRIWAMLLPFS